MLAFEADGIPHRTRDLCAYDQYRLLRAVLPVLPAVLAIDLASGTLDGMAIVDSLQGISASEISHAFVSSADAAERDDGDEWRRASKALTLPGMLTLVLAVVEDNFEAYLSRSQPEFTPASGRKQEFTPVFMPDGESWLFRPCECDPPLIDFLALFDGRAKIEHVAKANDLLDVRSENDFRATKD